MADCVHEKFGEPDVVDFLIPPDSFCSTLWNPITNAFVGWPAGLEEDLPLRAR